MEPNILLKSWIDAQEITGAEAARRLGYDRGNFHRILSGAIRPSIDLAHAIDVMTDGAVPMAAWASPSRTEAA